MGRGGGRGLCCSLRVGYGQGGAELEGWGVCVGGVPGMVLGSVDVLKESTPGSDLPCWFSATTWTSYSVSQSRPLSTTYSLLCGMRISGFQSLPCFCGWGGEEAVESLTLSEDAVLVVDAVIVVDGGHFGAV